jgi:hypothetical protein
MDSINPKTLWIEPLFDVSEPYLYAVVLPPLVLFALGMRRAALVFFLGAASLFTILSLA